MSNKVGFSDDILEQTSKAAVMAAIFLAWLSTTAAAIRGCVLDFKPRGRSVSRRRKDTPANQKPEENWKPHIINNDNGAAHGESCGLTMELELFLAIKLEYKVDETW